MGVVPPSHGLLTIGFDKLPEHYRRTNWVTLQRAVAFTNSCILKCTLSELIQKVHASRDHGWRGTLFRQAYHASLLSSLSVCMCSDSSVQYLSDNASVDTTALVTPRHHITPSKIPSHSYWVSHTTSHGCLREEREMGGGAAPF